MLELAARPEIALQLLPKTLVMLLAGQETEREGSVKFAVAASLIVMMGCAMPAAAQDHACASDAVSRARKLIRFHLSDPGMEAQISDGSVARRVADIPLLKGRGKLDVLEVSTDVYKAGYRMRFLYAQIPGSCALLGQEILETSNPY